MDKDEIRNTSITDLLIYVLEKLKGIEKRMDEAMYGEPSCTD